jgi:hypothetical protein
LCTSPPVMCLWRRDSTFELRFFACIDVDHGGAKNILSGLDLD